jgi:hypothetical protein
MDAETRERLITRYAEGPAVVEAALEGASDAELDARPAPGEWTAREVVHHLADSEMTSAIRLRLLIAEDRPELKGYDQEEFARILYYDRPIASSMIAFAGARAATTDLLRRLSEEQWAREGTHTESGRYTVLEWLAYYADHAHDHADQIREARASLGSRG